MHRDPVGLQRRAESGGTCSWSKVRTSQSRGERAQGLEVGLVADGSEGTTCAADASGGLGQHAQRDRRARSPAAGIIRASCPPPTMPTTGNPPGARCGDVTPRSLPVHRCTGRSRRADPEAVAPEPLTLLDRARGAMDVLVREMLKFGVVGAVAFVVDIGVFNMLRSASPRARRPGSRCGPRSSRCRSPPSSPWLGNRYWTFRHRRQRQAHHEAMLFIAFNVVGMASPSPA